MQCCDDTFSDAQQSGSLSMFYYGVQWALAGLVVLQPSVYICSRYQDITTHVNNTEHVPQIQYMHVIRVPDIDA